MGDKPLLFCDVDGVISLWGGQIDQSDLVWAQIEGIPHALSRRALRNLRILAASFDVVWATGWEEKAEEHLRPLVDLPGPVWPHLELDAARGAGLSVAGHWKLGAIEAHAGPRRALAFIDDVLDDRCHRWAAGRAAPTLLVPTDPARGLDDAARERLESFVRDVTSPV